MKSNFLILLFLFSLSSLIFGDGSVRKKAYLLNVNGISIYKSKDVNQKIGALNYKDEFSIFEANTGDAWVTVLSGNTKGFIRKTESTENEILIFTDNLKKSFLVTRKPKNQITQKPFSDEKPLLHLDQFSILEIVSQSYPDITSKDAPNEIWYEVKFKGEDIGYTKDISVFYDSLEKAKSVVAKKQLELSGYLLVTNPIYFKEPGVANKENKIEKNGLSKKGEFLFVKESREINGVKYFYTVMNNPSRKYKMEATPKDFDESPVEGWISEKDAKYFSEKEFSRYTLKNSTSKTDRLLLEEIFAQNENLPLNFLNVYKQPLGAKNKSSESRFFITSLYTGYVNSSEFGNREPYSLVCEKQEKGYRVFGGNIINRGKFEFFDLDKDGTPEVFSAMDSQSMSRVAFTAPAFYAYINGAYKEIPLPGNFLDTYKVDENFLYKEKRNDGSKKMEQTKYKYLHGKFLEVRN